MDPHAVRLEEKVAHLERHLGELDEVVRELYGRMDRYAGELKALRALTEAGQAGAEGDATDQGLKDGRPPHW